MYAREKVSHLAIALDLLRLWNNGIPQADLLQPMACGHVWRPT